MWAYHSVFSPYQRGRRRLDVVKKRISESMGSDSIDLLLMRCSGLEMDPRYVGSSLCF